MYYLELKLYLSLLYQQLIICMNITNFNTIKLMKYVGQHISHLLHLDYFVEYILKELYEYKLLKISI